MVLNPLDVLKKGLAKIQSEVAERRQRVEAKLKRREAVTEEEENWLDTVANTANEEQVIDELEQASDYERGLGRLDEIKRNMVNRLTAAAGKGTVSKKRKRT